VLSAWVMIGLFHEGGRAGAENRSGAALLSGSTLEAVGPRGRSSTEGESRTRSTAPDSASPRAAAPEAVAASIELLYSVELFARVPDVVAFLRDVGPMNAESRIDVAFAECMTAPTPEGLRRLLTACRDEYAARAMDAANGRASTRPESRESLQEMYLRMAVAVEYAGVSGALDRAESDKVLYDLSTFTGFDGQGALGDVFGAMVDRRMRDSIEDEARWAATPADELEDQSRDAASRHWVWAMLGRRMQDAAARGDEAAFGVYAQRVLAIPHGGKDREVFERYDAKLVVQARETLDEVLRGR
jgi:hypothetical protein